MANDCLVTRLKAVVSNDNLHEIGEIKLSTVALASISWNPDKISVYVNTPVSVKVDGNGYMASSRANLEDESKRFTEVSFDTPKELYFKNDNYNIYIKPKYGITSLMCYSGVNMTGLFRFDINTLDYMADLETICIGSATGDISNFKTSPLLNRIICSGDISGNIKSLASLTALNYLDFSNSSNVGGNIEEFAAAQVLAGRGSEQSETVTCKFQNTNIKYQGQSITSSTITITYDSSLPNGHSVS